MRNDSARAFESLRAALAAESDFYRALYGPRAEVVARASADGSWEAVPLLTRNDIAARPLRERTLIPWQDVEAIRPTSGTSGRGIICMGRIASFDAETLFDRTVRACGVTRIASMSGAQFIYASTSFRTGQSIAIDPGDSDVSVALVEAFRPDMISGTCHALLSLVPRLTARVRESLRAIVLFGEWSSASQRASLRAYVPHASLIVEYASVDSQTTIACSCAVEARKGSGYVHPVSEFVHVELIDPESGRVACEAGESGEIVVTTLRRVPTPLIRYRTGDLGRIVADSCACGEATPLLSIDGRLEYDRIRIDGGEVQLAALDAAFVAAGASRFAGFQVAIRDHRLGERIVPQLVVRLPAPELARWDERTSQAFAAGLRVSPASSYADGVVAGRYAPVVVEVLPPFPDGRKPRRLIRESVDRS